MCGTARVHMVYSKYGEDQHFSPKSLGGGGTSGHLTDNDFWISCIQIDQATKFDLNVTILSQKERQGHPQDLAICLWYPYHKNNKIKKIHLQNSPKFQKKLKCLIINEN